MNQDHPNRKSVRLRDYDYRGAGAYFVTICTQGRACSLAEVVDGKVHLSRYGQIVDACWRRLPFLFSFVEVDAYVVMPNHLHGILILNGDTCRVEAPADELAAEQPSIASGASPVTPAHGTVPGSLASIIQAFKSTSSRRIRAVEKSRVVVSSTVWQQG